MTEPDEKDVPDFPATSGPAAPDVAALGRPGAGQVVSPPPPQPESGEVVLATNEPHTFHTTGGHVITPEGVVVPHDKVDEYIESGQRFGVLIYQKEV